MTELGREFGALGNTTLQPKCSPHERTAWFVDGFLKGFDGKHHVDKPLTNQTEVLT